MACHYVQSVHSGFFFERSHLSFREPVFLSYWWAQDTPQDVVMRELGLSSRTVVDWHSFHRDLAIQDIVNNPPQFGGVDDNGEPVIVKIDESKYFHRKYHRGTWHEGHWVFGAIERNSDRCMIKVSSMIALDYFWITFGLLIFRSEEVCVSCHVYIVCTGSSGQDCCHSSSSLNRVDSAWN
eukprot:scpid93700/ scgid26644/ 